MGPESIKISILGVSTWISCICGLVAIAEVYNELSFLKNSVISTNAGSPQDMVFECAYSIVIAGISENSWRTHCLNWDFGWLIYVYSQCLVCNICMDNYFFPLLDRCQKQLFFCQNPVGILRKDEIQRLIFQSKVLGKVPERVPLFMEIPYFHYSTV